jgi:hypothetical protein
MSLPTEVPVTFLPTVNVPPSRPNRNSLNLRFNGNLFGKISSEFVGIVIEFIAGAVERLEAEEECEEEEEDDEVTFCEFVKFIELLEFNNLLCE